MAGMTFEERVVLKVPRGRINDARERATFERRRAEEMHRQGLVRASRWELYAALLEQGYDEEEAGRRAFRPRLDLP